ncbi:MAG: hypothetical protein LBP31_03270 [Holosporales bacterium]|nr:hypothetical protein [Holosporales bacterium]
MKEFEIMRINNNPANQKLFEKYKEVMSCDKERGVELERQICQYGLADVSLASNKDREKLIIEKDQEYFMYLQIIINQFDPQKESYSYKQNVDREFYQRHKDMFMNIIWKLKNAVALLKDQAEREFDNQQDQSKKEDDFEGNFDFLTPFQNSNKSKTKLSVQHPTKKLNNQQDQSKKEDDFKENFDFLTPFQNSNKLKTKLSVQHPTKKLNNQQDQSKKEDDFKENFDSFDFPSPSKMYLEDDLKKESDNSDFFSSLEKELEDDSNKESDSSDFFSSSEKDLEDDSEYGGVFEKVKNTKKTPGLIKKNLNYNSKSKKIQIKNTKGVKKARKRKKRK